VEVVFSKQAKAEVLNAAAFYEEKAPGLGEAFLLSLDAGTNEIVKFPLAYRVIRNDFRRFLMARYPYGIIYRIEEDLIFVAAVMHMKRRPSYWVED